MSRAAERRDAALAALVPALAGAAALAPAVLGGFLNWDDGGNIVRNPWLGRLDGGALAWAFRSTLYGHFQPLAWLSLSLDAALWGADARGCHATALALHAAAAAALGSVLRRLLGTLAPSADSRRRALAAAAAAALWAVHPLRVEAVAWATERRELLAALFGLLSVRAYLRDASRGRAPEGGAAVLWFGAACLSKVTAAGLPAVLLGLDRWVLGRGWRWREKASWWALAAATVALGVRAQRLSGTEVPLSLFGVRERLAQALYGPGSYALKTLLPVGLSPFVYVDAASEPGRWAAGAAATLACAAALALAARRRPGARALALALAVLLLPSLGLFKSGPQTAADRFAHMPSAALAAALAWALCLPSRRAFPAALAACAAAALALGAAAALQCRVWRDSVSLWSAAAAREPVPPLVLRNLGGALREAGREGEARAVFARLAAAAPDSAPALALRGDARYEAGDWAGAAGLYADALAREPELVAVRRNLGLALYRLGRRAEAADAFAEAARRDPLDAESWHDLGVALAALDRREDAARAFAEALRLEPGRAATVEALGKLVR